MAGIAEQQLTLEESRDRYADRKPYFEYWDGQAIQKSVPTKLHAKLQQIILDMLRELGYKTFPELTLRISPDREPTPDVVANVKEPEDPYPTSPVDVVVEILSPADRFSIVQEKCERYSDLESKIF